MSIIGLYGERVDKALDAELKSPPPESPQSFSTWSMLSAGAKGVPAAGLQVGASLSELLAPATQASARRPLPAALRDSPFAADLEERRQADAKSQADAGPLMRQEAATFAPAETAHAADQVLYGLTRLGTKAVGALALPGGVAVAGTALAAEETNTQYRDLVDNKHIDPATALKVAGVQGAAAGLSVALPMVGPTIKSTVGLSLASGPGMFVAQESLAKDILQKAGYAHEADTHDPTDPLGLALSIAIPGAVGGVHIAGLRRAPPTLAGVVQSLESGGRRFEKDGVTELRGPATSKGVAKGDMQVLDTTNLDPGFGVRPADTSGTPAQQAGERARVGADYIEAMHTRYGDPDKALAAYNWGPGNLDKALAKYGDQWLEHAPPETQKYVAKGMRKLGDDTLTHAASTPEVVDAARVRVTQDALHRSLPDRVEPAEVFQAGDAVAAGEMPQVRALSDDAMIEQRFAAKLAADHEAAVAEYATRPDSKGGKVLNTDIARELSPDYLANRTKSAAVHEPASGFVKRLYAERLDALQRGDSVVFTAGGTGAGKSTAIDAVPQIKALADRAAIIYDTNMNEFPSARKKIDQAILAGGDVTVVHVQRDPVDALVHGALSRAMRQEKEFGTGRTVPIAEHAKTHRGAAETVQALAEHYKDDPRVHFHVIDNDRGAGQAALSDLSLLSRTNYNGLEGRLHETLRSERDAARISPSVYAGFRGADAEAQGVRPAAGRGDGAGLEQGNGNGAGSDQGARAGRPVDAALGRSDTALTERGVEIPVRWGLVEADSLVTSHTNALTKNLAYPAELQPRDRGRAASEQQIAKIENGIRPELLGDSPKASDGAPIIGADGIVESGNARTIALRRAYESGKADAYHAWVKSHLEQFGVDAKAIEGMRHPVLVRIGQGQYDRAEFARQANESTVAQMSQTELAGADAARMPDLAGLSTNEDGGLNIASSSGFIRQFMQQVVSPSERGSMMTASGELSQHGLQRIRNAVFSKAYGDAELVAMMAESTDVNVKNILAGMLRAAPQVAKLRDLQDAGARHSGDLTGPLVAAVRKFSQLRSDGMTVDQFLAQTNMFDSGISPEVEAILKQLQADSKAPKRVAEMVEGMADRVDSLGDPRQVGMFDAAPAERVARLLKDNPDLLVNMPGSTETMTAHEAHARAKAEYAADLEERNWVTAALDCALSFGA